MLMIWNDSALNGNEIPLPPFNLEIRRVLPTDTDILPNWVEFCEVFV